MTRRSAGLTRNWKGGWSSAAAQLAAANWELVRAAEETQRQKDLLAVTLASIGDGVIVTDAQGFVTFLNGEAERLTRHYSPNSSNLWLLCA